MMAQQELRDLLASMDPLAQQEPAQLVLQDLQVPPALLVPMEPLAIPELQDLPALQEQRV
jgi:hypothetical protein